MGLLPGPFPHRTLWWVGFVRLGLLHQTDFNELLIRKNYFC